MYKMMFCQTRSKSGYKLLLVTCMQLMSDTMRIVGRPFMAPRSVKSASGSVESSTVGDEALELTASEIRSNPSRIWNSLELHNM